MSARVAKKLRDRVAERGDVRCGLPAEGVLVCTPPSVSTFIDNRYKLLRQLGAGGMGVVWEAEHTGVGRRVAVKLLHKSLLDKETSLLNRLQREARLAGSLDSPHIAAVLDTGIDPASGSPYLVMEYLVGEDLQTLITRATRLPPALAMRIAAQACLGLKKAHEANIIHRDVKPANMFLARRDGEVTVKILDFGIAKLKADDLASLDQASLTRTGSLIGSPLFMSPEQARGMKTIDQRADVWSLGVVLFNMLTGRTPYDSIDALGELILAICSTASPSVRDFAPEVPMKVAEIVQRALQIAPEARYQNAGEMFDAIVAELDGPRTIATAALDEYPEPPPGSRRFLPATPAGPSGTAVLPSAQGSDIRESGPRVTPGSVSMTISTTPPPASGDTMAAAAPGGTPVPIPGRESLPASPAGETKSTSAAAAGAPPPSPASSTVEAAGPKGGARPKVIGAFIAVGLGALGAWLLMSGGSRVPEGRASDSPPSSTTPASTAAANAAPGPSAVLSGAVTATGDVPAPSASTEVTPVSSAVESPASKPSAVTTSSAKAPRTGAGSATSRPTAKPVDTSGFGDRK